MPNTPIKIREPRAAWSWKYQAADTFDKNKISLVGRGSMCIAHLIKKQ
jgi:hypothetical protein